MVCQVYNSEYETRSWATSHSGPLLVHAAKRIETDIPDELREIVEDEFGGHWARELPAGALIALCDKVICKPAELVKIVLDTIDHEELAQGNFTSGRFAWDPFNMRELPAPIPWRGMQQLFDVPDHIVTGSPPAQSPQRSLL